MLILMASTTPTAPAHPAFGQSPRLPGYLLLTNGLTALSLHGLHPPVLTQLSFRQVYWQGRGDGPALCLLLSHRTLVTSQP